MGPGYKAILGTHVQNEKCKCTSPIKWGKREKPRGKKPSPKKRDERGCMDGWSNQDPPIMKYIQYIHKRMEKEKTSYEEKVPPKKEKKEMR